MDKTIKIWDLRNTSAPVSNLCGHGYAVRRAKFSPHSGNVVGSVSYDMSMRIWTIEPGKTMAICRTIHNDHSEFVLGMDFSLFNPGFVATCAWDEKIHFLHI